MFETDHYKPFLHVYFVYFNPNVIKTDRIHISQ